MKRPVVLIVLLGLVGVLLGLKRQKPPRTVPGEKRTEKIDITPQVEAFEAGKTDQAHP
ncbi:hypothetical protein [Deinococcus roseus]|uniref:Uncharacterized protein n=1 Tax=Deinococcus roseus TaxID=392414 RepID=A0ABQ2CX67_9DEIO|nr:hypothetical protein [Deinococcus roseus]GGJ22495.1 hypothetical protein GCM10008938_05950 [Deinococcus roseus]